MEEVGIANARPCLGRAAAGSYETAGRFA